jgi:hypothetical protein
MFRGVEGRKADMVAVAVQQGFDRTALYAPLAVVFVEISDQGGSFKVSKRGARSSRPRRSSHFATGTRFNS